MVDKKKILEELYEADPSLKLDDEKTEKLISFFANYNPNIKASSGFKNKLGQKLTTIAEFKQLQTKQKFSFMFFLRPLFVVFVAVFALLQFKNFMTLKDIKDQSAINDKNVEILIPNNTDSIFGKIQKQLQAGEPGKEGVENIKDTTINDSDIQKIITPNEVNTSGKVQVQEINENNSIDDSQNMPDPASLNEGVDNSSNESEAIDDIQNDNQSESTTPILLHDSNTDEAMSAEKVSGNDTIEGDYYTCENMKLVIEDSIDQRRTIKSYCDSIGGEIMNGGGNVKYYLCKLPSGDEEGLEYIEKELCQ